MELLTRNNFEGWMQKLMERLDRQDELLLSLQPSGKVPNPIERIRMFDNQDLCMLLQISKRTLQRYRDSGCIPFSKIGRNCRYRLSDIERALEMYMIDGTAAKPDVLHRQYLIRTRKMYIRPEKT